MRKIIYIISMVVVFLVASQQVKAQYPNHIHRERTRFVYDNGVRLSDGDLINIIGIDTFTETVIGARKQYNAGGNLMFWGTMALLTGVFAVDVSDFGAFLLLGGGIAMDVGIVFRIIGNSRLNWVEDYTNAKNHYLNFGPTQNGVGLYMKF